jgi:predicted enzyme related to lactoylglutathione lyase
MITIEITLDCLDPERLAPFWAEALGYRRIPAHDPYVALAPRNGTGPRLLLQRVPEPKTVKNRMHIDLRADHFEHYAERLVALGARHVRPDVVEEEGTASRWIVLADPEGNEFCVVSARPSDEAS